MRNMFGQFSGQTEKLAVGGFVDIYKLAVGGFVDIDKLAEGGFVDIYKLAVGGFVYKLLQQRG